MIPRFSSHVQESGLSLDRLPLETLQVNIGRLCNQACHHCHVEAGPKRTENMSLKTVDRLVHLLSFEPQIKTVDITGGAPELNPNFRYFVLKIREMGKQVIDRCNLTVLSVPGQEDTAEFLASQQIKIVASLPCYSKKNVDQQRGNGVFEKSIEALRSLNRLGYGRSDSGLTLDLVYNPLGPSLPPAQVKLEEDYKRFLKDDFGIVFNSLFTITNMPIKRFLNDLNRNGRLEEYMTLLANSFNPEAAKSIMCRNLVSIGHDGQIYDCDFNQMLEMPVSGRKKSVFEIERLSELQKDEIYFEDHCFGCTAGAGSSCGGALA